jgi:hypothetical protein
MKNALKEILIPIAKPVLSKIHRYKDIYKKESCYIIGGGISMKWFELGSFSDKKSIVIQYLPFHREFDQLDVDHVMQVAPFWFYPFIKGAYGEYGKEIQREYRKVIKNNKDKNFILNLSNFPVIQSKNITWFYKGFHDLRLPKNFITNRIPDLGGSLVQSLLMAIYFGCDHVYLVGFDYTHNPSRNLHWIEKGQGVFGPHENYHKEFFEVAKEFIDITTITLDGSSDFINAVTYKEHTGRDPLFRENTELLDEFYLKALDTCPSYTIF